MSSFGNNPNSWTPFSSFRDCSQGICSIYCPQWCYIIYPPPPPPNSDLGGLDSDDPSGFEFSPLIVVIVGILTSVFILATYYAIISRYCRGRRSGQVNHDSSSLEMDENGDHINNGSSQASSSGLDEALIKSITVCKYKKGDRLIEGTDCSVCLSEFQDNESLRLLPKCNHAFHLPCIDTWLKSHSSCPLCRSNIIIASSATCLPHHQIQADQSSIAIQDAVNINVSTLEYHHRRNYGTITVVQNLEGSLHQDNRVVSISGNDKDNIVERDDGTVIEIIGQDQEEFQQPIKRSILLNSCSSQCRVTVSDILNATRDDEEFQRSISAGRLVFQRYEK
ncbi:RING-H2 finger protein [Quillaja saponaria]|uniref:RING-type E3 ubiquitin transferase n=1 Tax=Quillaja saponaria TaxID=32244 RepID=A0AAD7LP94_QUISA|nr:RING-H2 finger protein [Quillaja saponaria]KAJ7961824.1 RING-H2 finger protein [Quillaja saponaria]